MAMDAKEMKQIETMLTRAVGVIAEDAQHKFDILAEGHKMLADKLDRTDLRIDNMESRIDKIDSKIDQLDSKVDRLDKKVDQLDKKIDRMDSKIDAVAADLTAHRY